MIASTHVRELIRLALAEDIGPGDLTTELTVDPNMKARAQIIAKQDLIVSGLIPAVMTFEEIDDRLEIKALVDDGDPASAGKILITASGSAASLLTAERIALNLLMHLSGVATQTRKYVKAVQGTGARVIDTRKTTPGMRALEKAAVRHGGGFNHRFGLYDGILIKDNHIKAVGSIKTAIQKARNLAPHTLKVEVEVEDMAGLKEAVSAGADAVLLDNMTIEQMTEAVKFAKGKVMLEASGGVNITNIARVAGTGVDYISVGALTHSAPSADMSMNFI